MTLSEDMKAYLKERYGNRVRWREPMAHHTTYRVGGPVDVLVVAESVEQIRELVIWCRKEKVPWFVLGGGSNLLISDKGVSGMAICLAGHLREVVVHPEEGVVTAMAGAPLSTLRQRAMAAGLSGLEFTWGIPGTVGGAVRCNAGTRQGEMARVVSMVGLVDLEGTVRSFSRDDLIFSYRRMRVPGVDDMKENRSPVIVYARFQLTAGDPRIMEATVRSMAEDRRRTQPGGWGSAGCFFKNPPTGPGAGALIDGLGLKGRSVGGAQISPVHANFIVNNGNARASDILSLARMARDAVAKRHGIRLEPEVIILGDTDGALESGEAES